MRLRTIFPFGSGHVQTLFPPLLRQRPRICYERERFELSDGDFVDLDWCASGRPSLVILLHGLEGHSGRTYMLGMARAARIFGHDVLAMNFRGCSGEPNRHIRMYHSGWTCDVHEVLRAIQERAVYDEIFLVGFSLGGNVALKYLGEDPNRVPPSVRGCVGISVPCDLEDSAQALIKWPCQIYTRYLIGQLRKKVLAKARLFPDALDIRGIERITTFQQFDDRYTAPLHGFVSAREYWRKSSCKQYLQQITLPTCIMNARNDPFLGPGCYPVSESQGHACIELLVPETGGHVGFVPQGDGYLYWSEWRAMYFFCQCHMRTVPYG